MSTTAATGTVPSQASSATLHAEIARYQKQLAERENCPSSKTPQGKENIQAISNKLSADKTALRQIEAARPPSGSAAAPPGAGTYTGTGRPADEPHTGATVNVYA